MEHAAKIDPEVTRSLLQTALLAIWERQYAQAETILHGLSAVDSELVQITYGYTLLYQALGQTEQAIALLRQTLREQPDNDMAKSLLAFTLQQDGRSGWRELLQEVLANDAETPAVELAQHLLQGESVRQPACSAAPASLDFIRA